MATSWDEGTVTAEQVIGQVLQLLRVHDERLRELERARREAAAPRATSDK